MGWTHNRLTQEAQGKPISFPANAALEESKVNVRLAERVTKLFFHSLFFILFLFEQTKTIRSLLPPAVKQGVGIGTLSCWCEVCMLVLEAAWKESPITHPVFYRHQLSLFDWCGFDKKGAGR